MTVAGERELGLEWHPDAVRPPCEWTMALPSDWTVVDTHPASWKRRTERIIDDVFAGKRLTSAQRRDVRGYLAGVVAGSQKARILLTLVKFGVDESEIPEAVGLTVRWASNAPRMASLATVRKGLSGASETEEFTGANGARMILRRERRSQLSGGKTEKVTHLQGFMPAAGTQWTLVVTMSTTRTDLDETLDTLLRRIIGSVKVLGDQAATADSAVADPATSGSSGADGGSESFSVTRFEAPE